MMAMVSTIRPELTSTTAPDSLRKLPGWLIWRYEQTPGEAKPRKVPYYTTGNRRHGVQGRPEDRNQLTTFDAAKASAARRGFDGVGFALLPEFGIVALDFDHCMVEGGAHPEVERMIAGTYAEYSPSGEGIRAFLTGNLGNNKSHGEPFGFEAFSTKGFVTFTGNRLELTDMLGTENTVAPVSDDVRTYCTLRFGKRDALTDMDDPLAAYSPRLGLTPEQIHEALDVLDPDMGHNAWLNVGLALHHETEGEGFDYWNEWSAGGSKYPGEDALQRRWESFGQHAGSPVSARTLIKMAHENGAHISHEIASAAEFDNVADTPAADTPPEKMRFKVEPAGAFSQGAHPGWVVKGVIPKAEVIVMFGESGSGKSFVATDMAMAIARGVEWRGLRTRRGRVVYIAAEGGGGFRKRLAAYAIHHGIDLEGLPFGVIHAAPNFLQKADALDVAKSIQASGGADVVVVDTFAQVIPGANENAAEDVGKALAHCRGIHRATGAVVLLIHHAGKDKSKGARGWSGLRAAADAELEVIRTVTGRYVRVSKQKDGDDQGEWGFDLQIVPVGMDEDGDVVDSCVVVDAAVPVQSTGQASGRRKLGPWESLAAEVVSEFALAQSDGIEVEAVLAEMVSRRPPPENGKRDTRRFQCKRGLMSLCEGAEALYLLEDGCLSIL